jgi:peptidoglycan hydrolase-like protein with peptidoglycan-binding domain
MIGGRTRPLQPRQPSVQGATIRQAQERLGDRGFNPGPRDGQMGEKTQVALRQFQRAHGLPPTGVLDDATRAALGLE